MKFIIILIFVSICLLAVSLMADPTQPADQSGINQHLSNIPIAFTKNMGQWPDSILFRASAAGATIWFIKDGIYYQFTRRVSQPHASKSWHPDLDKFSHKRDSVEMTMIKAQFVGANSRAEVIGLDEQAYKCNYFLGNDPAKWYTDVPNYSAVSFNEIYPGVEATFHGENGKLAYELHGSAEAVSKVQTACAGAPTKEEGDVTVVQTKLGDRRFRGLLPASERTQSAPSVGTPAGGSLTLVYSTYLGGDSADVASDIEVDSQGFVYVVGTTYSVTFPTQSPYQKDPGDSFCDIFVAKLSESGGSLIYSTYLGGTFGDWGYGIAVDGSNCVYIGCGSVSDDFPTKNAFQAHASLYKRDAIVAKLSATGNILVYSTYLGGTSEDEATDIAVDRPGNAYVTGCSNSTDFPTQVPYQTAYGGSAWDTFVSKLSVAGSGLVYSTYLGGDGIDYGYGIFVDTMGIVYVTGSTNSRNFPTQSPFRVYENDASDAFVTKLSASGNSLAYSTYLGGSGSDQGNDIAVDDAGCAYIVGSTWSTNFPTQTPFQTDPDNGPYDAFVTKLSATGASLVYSTYLGGSRYDYGLGIAIDPAGCAFITGSTEADFPVRAAYQPEPGDTVYYISDAFVAKLSTAGNSLGYSTYLGGNSGDKAYSIAVDVAGCAYVVGQTWSTDFPSLNAYDASYNERGDAFVTKLSFTPGCCTGTTGNVNMTGITDLSDLTVLVNYLTITPPPALLCSDEANVNAAGIVDLSDLTLLVSYLTLLPPPNLPDCP